jgi:hypothetical protein
MGSMIRNLRWLAPLAILALAAALVGLAGQDTVLADDFRIHTKVFAGETKQPLSENITLFHEGRAYDFTEGPAEALVFDLAAGRFLLLDPRRKLWTEITLPQLDAFVAELRQKLASRQDEFAAFLVTPRFEQETSGASGEIDFVAPWMRYQVRAASASSDAVATQYAAFSSHSTRLAALRRAPLLARVAVNDWLQERKLIPQSVRLTTFSKDREGRLTVDAALRSEHAIEPKLTRDDLARIAQVATWQAEFRRVSLTTYWTPAE